MKEKWSKKFDKPHSLLGQYEEIRTQLRDCKNTAQRTELLEKKELLKAKVEIEYEKLIAQAEGSNPYQIEFDIDERYCQESKPNDDIDKKYNLGILEKKIISLSFYRNNAKDCKKMYQGSVLSSLNWIHFDTFSYQKAKMLNYSTLATINGISPQDTTKGFPDYELAYVDSTGFTKEETEADRYSQNIEESDFQRIRNDKDIKGMQAQHSRVNVVSRTKGMSKKFQDIYGTTHLEDSDTSIQIIRLPDVPQKAVLYDDKGILRNLGKKKTKYETKNLIYRITKKLKIMEVDHIDAVVTPQKENVFYAGLRKEGLFEFVNKETKFYTPQDFPLSIEGSSPSPHPPQADSPQRDEGIVRDQFSSLGGKEGKVRERKDEEFPVHSNIHKKPTYEIVNIPVSKHRAKSTKVAAGFPPNPPEAERTSSLRNLPYGNIGQGTKSIEHDIRCRMQDTGYKIHDAGYRMHDTRYRIQDSHDTLSKLPNIPNETGTISKYIIPTMTMKEYYLEMLDDRMQDTGYKIHDAGYRIQDPGSRMQDTGDTMQDASTNEQFTLSFSGERPISKNSMHSPIFVEKELPFPVIMERLFALSPSLEDNKVRSSVSLIPKDQISKNIDEKRFYPTISPAITSDKMQIPSKNDDRHIRSAEHSESDFVLLSLFNSRDKATSSYAEGRNERPVVKIDRQNKSIPVQKASPQREEDKDVSLQETGVSAKSTVRELFSNFCREYTRKKKMHDI